MATVAEVMEALAGQIRTALEATIVDVQVERRLVPNPTPPTIDIFPGEAPFGEQIAMGHGERELFLTIRARVAVGDNDTGQDLLLSMMDPGTPESVGAAIAADKTLGGLVGAAVAEGPTGYLPEDGGTTGELLGCRWRTRVVL